MYSDEDVLNINQQIEDLLYEQKNLMQEHEELK